MRVRYIKDNNLDQVIQTMYVDGKQKKINFEPQIFFCTTELQISLIYKMDDPFRL